MKKKGCILNILMKDNTWTVKIGEGSGPLFMVVDPGVHYQGPLPSPILMVIVMPGLSKLEKIVSGPW